MTIIKALTNEITKDISLTKLERKLKLKEKKLQNLKTKLKMKRPEEWINKYLDFDQKIILMQMNELLS